MSSVSQLLCKHSPAKHSAGVVVAWKATQALHGSSAAVPDLTCSDRDVMMVEILLVDVDAATCKKVSASY